MPTIDPNIPVKTANIEYVEGRDPDDLADTQTTSEPTIEPEDFEEVTEPESSEGMSPAVIAVLGIGAAFVAYRLFVK